MFPRIPALNSTRNPRDNWFLARNGEPKHSRSIEIAHTNAGRIEQIKSGRKASTLMVNPNLRYIGICYFSATVLHVAVANLSGEILQSRKTDINIGDGPNENLSLSVEWLRELLKTYPKKKLLGIIAGVPGPVNHELGIVVSPPIMQGWDGINILEHYSKTFGVRVYLENDANLLVIAEHQLVYPDVPNLLLVKIGTGIGSGLVINGKIYQRTTALATRNIDILTSALGPDQGVLGAAQLGLDKFFYNVGS